MQALIPSAESARTRLCRYKQYSSLGVGEIHESETLNGSLVQTQMGMGRNKLSCKNRFINCGSISLLFVGCMMSYSINYNAHMKIAKIFVLGHSLLTHL